jgi:hypothetical protein
VTQEYPRAIAGSGLGDGVLTFGRVGLAGNLLLVRLHGADGAIQIVHDHSGTVRIEGEVLVVAPTQAGPGLTGYRVVGVPPGLDFFYIYDRGDLAAALTGIIMVNPTTFVGTDLGFPGFFPIYMAATGGWVCAAGGPDGVDLAIRNLATGWTTIPSPANITGGMGHLIHTIAFNNTLHLVYRTDASTLAVYALAPPSTTPTLVTSTAIAADLGSLRTAAPTRSGPDLYAGLQSSDLSTHVVLHWDGVTWTSLSLPGSADSQLVVPDRTGRLFYISSDDNRVYVSSDLGASWPTSYATSSFHALYGSADQAHQAILTNDVYAVVGRTSGAGNLPDGTTHYGDPSGPAGTERSYLIHFSETGTSVLRVSTASAQEINGVAEVGGVIYFSSYDSSVHIGTPYTAPTGLHRWDPLTLTFETVWVGTSGPRGMALGDRVT